MAVLFGGSKLSARDNSNQVKKIPIAEPNFPITQKPSIGKLLLCMYISNAWYGFVMFWSVMSRVLLLYNNNQIHKRGEEEGCLASVRLRLLLKPAKVKGEKPQGS